MKAQVNECENCGRPIGKLETPRVWSDHVVCAECEARLKAAAAPAGVTPPPVPPVTRGVPVQYALPATPRVQVIEQTSKKWKGMVLIAALGCFGSVIAGIISLFTIPPLVVLFVLTFIASFALLIIGRIGAWWNHG